MMEVKVFQLIALYFIYYIGVPGLIILIIWKIKQKKDFIKTFTIYNEDQKDKSSATLEKDHKKLKYLQVLFVVLILISMPVLSLAFHGLQDISMHTTRTYLSDETVYPAHIDRVENKIGPSFNIEEVIEQMEKDRGWYLDNIREQIDLDEITRVPGRITVYQLRPTISDCEQIVISYAHLSPIPITRSIEFIVLEGKAFLETNRLVAYPMPPSLVAPS